MEGVVHTALPSDHPIMKAWREYKETEDYRNSAKWAATHTTGSLWGAFLNGWNAANAFSNPISKNNE